MNTRTWNAAELDKVVAGLKGSTCPQCFPDPAPLDPCGPWRLSVGVSDVLLTAPAECPHQHCVTLSASLWARAKTPLGAVRVTKRSAPLPGAPRPLADLVNWERTV